MNNKIVNAYALPGLKFKDVEFSKSDTSTSDNIINVCCNYFNISREDILKKGRKLKIVWPRQVAMYLMRIKTNLPLTEIGKIFCGQMHHTTVMHSQTVVKNQCQTNDNCRKQVFDLLYMLDK